jgi:hypothetical protein
MTTCDHDKGLVIFSQKDERAIRQAPEIRAAKFSIFS